MNSPLDTLDKLSASLAAYGVSATDQRILLGLAKPAVALQSTAMADSEIEIGSSKIGGAPDLPSDMPWPTRGPTSWGMAEVEQMRSYYDTAPEYYGEEIRLKEPLYSSSAPLAFMLQIDLAACAASGPLDPDIPHEGRLLVFYDLILKPWSGHEEDGTSLFEVIYDATPIRALKRKVSPHLGYPLMGDYVEFKNCLPPAALIPIFTWTLPDGGSMPILADYAGGETMPHRAWTEAAPTFPVRSTDWRAGR